MAPRRRPLDDGACFNSGRRTLMRHLTFGATALSVPLFGAAVPAAAQSPGGMLNHGPVPTRGTIHLSPSHAHYMIQELRNEREQTPPSAFDGQVGSIVPELMS